MSRFRKDRPVSSDAAEVPGQTGPLTRVTYALGSLLSVALVIGLAVWGYKLMVRDVSGVPVIRAAEGPMRVQPEDPGGSQTLNQGLSVNDIAAVGAAGAAPDELILAPAPLDLAEEDAADAALEPPAAAPEQGVSATPEPAEEEKAVPQVDPTMLALAEAMGKALPPPEDMFAEDQEGASEDLMEGDGTGSALRPKARPQGLGTAPATAASPAPAAQAMRDVDPDTIPVGTRLAQLGAFTSEEIAQEEWDRLTKKFEEYLAGKDRVIQRATSGGRTFYRLRAMGFDDLADARRFCSALVAEKAECIPVVTR